MAEIIQKNLNRSAVKVKTKKSIIPSIEIDLKKISPKIAILILSPFILTIKPLRSIAMNIGFAYFLYSMAKNYEDGKLL